MNVEFIKAESRKVWWWYLPVLGLMAAYTVVWPVPLSARDPGVGVLAAVQGLLVSWRVFGDPGTTRSFVWSRPVSRLRLFLHRWLLGLGFQAFTIVLLFIVMAVGIRSALHAYVYNPFFPMIRWYELEALWPAAAFSLLGYQATLFFTLYAALTRGYANSIPKMLLRGLALGLFGLGVPLLVLGCQQLPLSWTPPALCAYIAVATLISTGASAHCYKNLEVEA